MRQSQCRSWWKASATGDETRVYIALFGLIQKSSDPHTSVSGNKSLSITWVDDHSQADTVDKCRQILGSTTSSLKQIHLADSTGNSASLHKIMDCADIEENTQDELYYFLEDDYLHAEEALTEMIFTYQKLKSEFQKDIVLVPYDYPDRYRGQVEPTYVILGGRRHWRMTRHSTATLMISKDLYSYHKTKFRRFSDYGVDPFVTEDTTLNQMYLEHMCFSPLPSLAVHLQYESVVCPFVPWQEWWNQSQWESRP